MAHHRPVMDRKKMRALYDDGKTDLEIGKILGVSHAAVRKHRMNLGLPSNATAETSWTEARVNALRRRAAKGEGSGKIAEAMGVSRTALRSAAKRYGIALSWTNPRAYSAEEDARIVAGVAEGLTHASIGAPLGRTAKSIAGRVRLLRAEGAIPAADGTVAEPVVPVPRVVQPPAARPAAICAPRMAGPSWADMRQERLDRLRARHGSRLVDRLVGLGAKATYARQRALAEEFRVPLRTVEGIWHQVRA